MKIKETGMQEQQKQSIKVIEKVLHGWNNKMKFACPECGKNLSNPDYYCDRCKIRLKLKVQM